MPTVANPKLSQEVRLPERIGRTVKAELPNSPAQSDFRYGQMIWDRLVRGHGSVKATAFAMGQKDESQIRRQVVEGSIRLREVFEADEAALCEFAEYVLETFKPCRKTRQQIARERIPELIALMLDAVEESR